MRGEADSAPCLVSERIVAERQKTAVESSQDVKAPRDAEPRGDGRHDLTLASSLFLQGAISAFRYHTVARAAEMKIHLNHP